MLAWAVLGGSPVLAADKVRVVMLNVNATSKKLEPLASSVTEQVMTELNETRRIDVVGSSDLAAVLGLERQKQLLGCGEQSTSCLAELSSALGAPWLVLGTLAQAGKSMRLDLKLIRAGDGKAIWRSGKSLKDEGEVFDAVSALVKGLIDALPSPTVARSSELPGSTTAATSPKPVVTATPPIDVAVAQIGESTSPPADPRIGPRALVIAGASLIGAGVIAFAIGSSLLGKASADYAGTSTTVQDVALRELGINLLHVSGIVAASLGLVGLVTGLAWWARLPDTTVAVTVGPQGLFVAGTF